MNTAFIGLDYIVDIMHPAGKVARSAQQATSRGVISKANAALALAKSNGWLSVLVKVGFHAGYHELPASSPMFGKAKEFGALALGQPGTDFHPDLSSDLADFVLTKPRISAFYGTPLEPLLRARKVDRLVLAGVSTAWAVQALAREAHDRDYAVDILEEACAAATAEEHETSIDLLRSIARIVSLEELNNTN
ncbi:isochorismatase family cysteine hydrolase [Hydrogenophaga sp.]|uniref:isochorismatase family cysteine hydrolase n=1 Tax=Hydrogenophaga sp. TaxID=1904254 RepID=UPI00271A1604|nr:isochorismatase family cysteine hydrolase [Hydrogenophaga sp.]MDO9435391.1 isochorismatase family cysteine hydrolase [Hydrogenophaga sp.]